MDIIFTDEQVVRAKSKWQSELREFAQATSATLQQARRLPIFDFAVDLATDWLQSAIETRICRRKHHTLVIAGDEHLQSAVTRLGLPGDSLFIYQIAWRRWLSGLNVGDVCWWQTIDWAINCPYRMIDLSSPHDHYLTLTPNKTFLCSEEVAGRGTHSILSIEPDGQIAKNPYSGWLIT